ncbi:MAG: thymidine phosphorylase, partial [Firmicutes bacterium]|nr:thymidine phosphorylase [Bacillota bacterium]
MRMYDIIKKKRDGGKLSDEEIRFFIEGYTDGSIPDYQAAAMCMAIYFRGMDTDEISALTLAVRDSGETLDFSEIDGIRVDKHSTGGVGDKTSLVIGPVAAACGVKVAKISGRGLGHTGGTVDKLESIKGLRTDISKEDFIAQVNRIGLAIIGQSADMAPADKKLYALRDVTATVDSLPLIVSSIMGKKLAAGDDCIVLDVKCGSGSFNKTLADGERLAREMVSIGERAGKKMLAVLSDMDKPLGRAIGNSLEVIEAVETLRGGGPDDFRELCLDLSAYMIELAGKGSREECLAQVREAVSSGRALKLLAEMVEAQGGDPSWIYDTDKFPKAETVCELLSPADGYIRKVDAESYGLASLALGAGRNTK